MHLFRSMPRQKLNLSIGSSTILIFSFITSNRKILQLGDEPRPAKTQIQLDNNLANVPQLPFSAEELAIHIFATQNGAPMNQNFNRHLEYSVWKIPPSSFLVPATFGSKRGKSDTIPLYLVPKLAFTLLCTMVVGVVKKYFLRTRMSK